MFIVNQNDDFKKTIQVKKGGIPTDLSVFTGIGVWLYYEDGTTLKKFSKNINDVGGNVMIGFAQLVIEDAAQGKMRILLNSAETKVATEGICDLVIKYQYTDADVTDGIFLKIIELPPSSRDLI
jgi:hypothetical protein